MLDRRQAYETEILSTFARLAGNRAPALADDTRARERALMRGLSAATEMMARAIADVNRDSSLVRISGEAFADFTADELPTLSVWEEKLAHAVNGY